MISGLENYQNGTNYGGGGVFHITAYKLYANIFNVSFQDISGSSYGYGGIFHFVGNQSIEINITNCYVFDATTEQMGQIIYGYSQKEITLNLNNNTFIGVNYTFSTVYDIGTYMQTQSLKTPGFFLISSSQKEIRIYSKNNTFKNFVFAGSTGNNAAGGVFSLLQNTYFDDFNSTFQYNAAIQAGSFFCSNCSIKLNYTRTDYSISEFGGFIYVDEIGGRIEIYNSIIRNSYSQDSGGFIFFSQGILYDDSSEFIFKNVSFSNTGSYFGGGLIAINCEYCRMYFDLCNFTKSAVAGLDFGKGTFNDGGFFHISGLAYLEIKNSRFVDLDTQQVLDVFNNLTQSIKVSSQYQQLYGSIILYAELNTKMKIQLSNNLISFSTTNKISDFINGLRSNLEDQEKINNTYQSLFKIKCQNRSNCILNQTNSTLMNNFIGDTGSIFNLQNIQFFDQNSHYLQNGAINGGIIYAQNSNLTFDSNTYNYNFAFSGAIAQISDDKTSFQLISSSFEHTFAMNSGGLVAFDNENVDLIIKNCRFNNHTAYEQNGGVLNILNAQYIILEENNFQLVYARNQGALMFASSISIKSIKLLSNYIRCQPNYERQHILDSLAEGSSIEIQAQNTFYISQVVKITSQFNEFTQCNFKQIGGVFYLDRSTFSDKNSQFTYNSAKSGGVIACTQCQLHLTDTIFEFNMAYQGAVITLDNIASLYGSYLQMSNNYVIESAGCILARTNSLFEITNSKFYLNTAENSNSVIQALGTNQLVLQSCQFINNTAKSNTFSIQYAKIKIITSSFLNNYATSSSKNIFLGFSDVVIQGCNFQEFQVSLKKNISTKDYHFALLKEDQTTGAFINCILSVQLKISNSQFKYGSSSNGGAIYVSGDNSKNNETAENGGAIVCLDCYGFHLQDSTFQNLKALQGGCISFVQTSNSRQGYLYMIRNSLFEGCTASRSSGGAISLLNTQLMEITDSQFIGNQSPTNGGAIYYQCDLSASESCTLNINKTNFSRNKALISGGAIYWEDVEPNFLQKVTFKDNLAGIYGNDIGAFAQKIAQITESQLQTARGEKQDERNRILQEIKTQNELSSVRSGQTIPTFYLALVDKYNQIVKIDDSSKLTVRVDTQFTEGNQQALQYAPVVQGQSQFVSQNGTFKVSDIIFIATPGYSFRISFSSDGIDKTKPSNQKYLEDLKDKNQTDINFNLELQLRECEIGECNLCQNKTSYNLIKQTSPGQCQECPTDKAVCLGGSNIGPQPNYWRKRVLQVKKMIQKVHVMKAIKEYYVQIAGMDIVEQEILNARTSIGVGIGMVFLIRSTLKGATQKKNILSIFTKILLNHLQLLLISSSFNFQWPDAITQFYSSFKPVSQTAQQIISIDCFLSGTDPENIKKDEYGKKTTFIYGFERIIYVKLFFMALLPIILFIICYGSWAIISCRKRDEQLLRTRAISSVVILFFFVYSNIVTQMLDAFNCINIDGESRLKNDLEIVCYQGTHRYMIFGVALPALLAWGLGIPFFASQLIFQERHKLDSLETRSKYGFLYRGYKKKFYYWESVIMYRKTILIFISVFFIRYGVIVQALVVLLLLIFGITKQLILKPYQTMELNLLELLSLYASNITIYIGIFFIINTLKENVIKKMPWIYLNFFACGNRQKFNLNRAKAFIKEENEILREEYMNKRLLENIGIKNIDEDSLKHQTIIRKMRKEQDKLLHTFLDNSAEGPETAKSIQQQKNIKKMIDFIEYDTEKVRRNERIAYQPETFCESNFKSNSLHQLNLERITSSQITRKPSQNNQTYTDKNFTLSQNMIRDTPSNSNMSQNPLIYDEQSQRHKLSEEIENEQTKYQYLSSRQMFLDLEDSQRQLNTQRPSSHKVYPISENEENDLLSLELMSEEEQVDKFQNQISKVNDLIKSTIEEDNNLHILKVKRNWNRSKRFGKNRIENRTKINKQNKNEIAKQNDLKEHQDLHKTLMQRNQGLGYKSVENLKVQMTILIGDKIQNEEKQMVQEKNKQKKIFNLNHQNQSGEDYLEYFENSQENNDTDKDIDIQIVKKNLNTKSDEDENEMHQNLKINEVSASFVINEELSKI
ncbi:UNKNOWN [Stylonychia lemnae]|uniref:Transmembrane protein n=1 Tax=Stylonychia lemnae TaxID=5949 RepID=A0A078B9I4_STYLE|nr:UNKNOWN [Stylonychia lemnae]|eukprot:CDW90223.1 UNKNOWN [Stylonychia lemnae]